MVQSLQAQQRSVHGKQAKVLVLKNINIFFLRSVAIPAAWVYRKKKNVFSHQKNIKK